MYKLLILDVDGVLTTGLKTYNLDGSVISKTFGDRDFTAIKEFICSGVNVIFLSGDNQVNSAVAKSRNIPFFYSRRRSGKLSKSECAEEILNNFNVEPENTIFVGDDLFDLEMRKYCKLMVCPANSHFKMKEVSDIILKTNSGYGCIQELYEYMIKNNLIKTVDIEDIIKRDAQESVKY